MPISACDGELRVIACIEGPPLIAKILGYVHRREALSTNTPRSPPVLQPELTLTWSGWLEAQGSFRLLAGFSDYLHGFSDLITW